MIIKKSKKMENPIFKRDLKWRFDAISVQLVFVEAVLTPSRGGTVRPATNGRQSFREGFLLDLTLAHRRLRGGSGELQARPWVVAYARVEEEVIFSNVAFLWAISRTIVSIEKQGGRKGPVHEAAVGEHPAHIFVSFS